MHQSCGHAKELALPRAARLKQLRLRAGKYLHAPENISQQRESSSEMRHEPIGGHIKPHTIKTRMDHQPADKPLQSYERSDCKQRQAPGLWQFASEKQQCEPKRPGQADKTPKLPVAPFPPENDLELSQAHRRILHSKFSGGLISGKGGLPSRGIQRRDGTHHRIPFRDRQATVRQAG